MSARGALCERPRTAINDNQTAGALTQEEAEAVFNLVDTQAARIAELEFAVAVQDSSCQAHYWEGFRDGEHEARKDAWIKTLGIVGLFAVGVFAGMVAAK